VTKKDLLKALGDGPVRCKMKNGTLRQVTRVSSTKEMKNWLTGLDDGATIGVWDMGDAVISTIKNADISSVIGSGLDKPDE